MSEKIDDEVFEEIITEGRFLVCELFKEYNSLLMSLKITKRRRNKINQLRRNVTYILRDTEEFTEKNSMPKGFHAVKLKEYAIITKYNDIIELIDAKGSCEEQVFQALKDLYEEISSILSKELKDFTYTDSRRANKILKTSDRAYVLLRAIGMAPSLKLKISIDDW